MARLHWTGHLGRGLFVIAAVIMSSAWQARADDQYVGVARISVLNGTVVMQHADSADKIAAVVNAPVMVGDYVTTGADSRTEVQLDDTNFVRAGAQTQMRFTRLDAADHTLQLAAGTVELSVLRYPEAHPQVQTPSITVRPQDAGRYRITVTDAGETVVTVRSGRADLVGPQGTQTVGAGISVLVTGSASDPRIQNVQTIAYDDFDSWNSERDRFTANALASTAYAASSYANSGIVGLSNLNGYGRWGYAPAYGNVWIPYGQVDGWSPYRWGRWAFQPYCGWTWIGYEPWGWAPYHYGRWFYQPGFGWAWYPGPLRYHYYWQPALVAFFGFGYGGGLGFGLTWGNVAWVPLAPFEAYVPWWSPGFGGSTILYNARIANVNNITKVYRNVGAPGGIAAIRGGDFNRGSKYDYLQVHSGDLRNVALAKGGLPIAPSTMGYRYTTGPGEVGRIAPMSPRFNELPQPSLPSVVVQRVTNQAAGAAGGEVAHAIGNTATSGSVMHTGSTDAWSRFGSSNGKTVTVVHTLNGTQTVVGSSTATKAAVSNAQGRADAGSSAWGRFESAGVTKTTTATGTARGATFAGTTNGWTAPVVHNQTDLPTMQRYGDPGSYRAPMSPYSQYAPSTNAAGHSTQWMMPQHSYAPLPNWGGAGFAPVHGINGSIPSGAASGHAGNGH